MKAPVGRRAIQFGGLGVMVRGMRAFSSTASRGGAPQVTISQFSEEDAAFVETLIAASASSSFGICTKFKKLCGEVVAAFAARCVRKHQRSLTVRRFDVQVSTMRYQCLEHIDSGATRRSHVGQPMRRRITSVIVGSVDIEAVVKAPDESLQVAATGIIVKLCHASLSYSGTEKGRLGRGVGSLVHRTA
ncbi:hypothetical protein CfE428DRAFT_0431 [Chthoniobacter flavus Ellin428]|uniref:Uncharacterized protein n=1 Tax=Chthoniobacter flavus Ellin428 TaxID=497964 RepID=B4CUR8_9BACT|nr:hypothetical protein CfE428DRAFT_0431 [Chthoniobacter flavus Ellin428]